MTSADQGPCPAWLPGRVWCPLVPPPLPTCQPAPSPHLAQGARAFSPTLSPPPSCCLEVPQGARTPSAQPTGHRLPGAPAADRLQASVPCLCPVPTSLLPGTRLGPGRLPSSCSFPGSLTRPGWLTPAAGSPCPPTAACAFLAEVSLANAHAAPDVFSRLLLFLDTEV